MTKTTLIPALLLALAACAPAQAGPAEGDLVAALQDQDPDIRALAAGLLGDEPEAAETAPEALLVRLADSDESWRVRVAAAESLARLEVPAGALNSLMADLVVSEDEDWRVRAAALDALRNRGGNAQLAAVLARSGEVRIANGLNSVLVNEPLADGSILDALADPDPRMRNLARAALDSRLEAAGPASAPVDEKPCISRRLAEVLGRAHATTGTLTVY